MVRVVDILDLQPKRCRWRAASLYAKHTAGAMSRKHAVMHCLRKAADVGGKE
jgi:hypothetical protein